MRRLSFMCGLFLAFAARAAAADPVDRARLLAQGGQRDESLKVLQEQLRADPQDSEALVLFGVVLSWEGRYDEARRALDDVLDTHPGHADALRASINVELWSDHPARAEELARQGLTRDPANPDLLLAHARAVRALDRLAEARRVWTVGLRVNTDHFDDGREAWNEGVLTVSRRFPGVGRVAVRAYHARRFGDDGDQLELEAFPRLRAGTYLDVGGAVAVAGSGYAKHRLQLDIYQSLGAGFEAAVGYRRLQFDGAVNIIVLTLTRYTGDWMLTARSFLTPDEAGLSVSVHASVRRYFGAGGTYVGLRYARGRSREEVPAADVATLASDTAAAEAEVALGRVTVGATLSYGRGEREGHADLGQLSVGAGAAVTF